MKIHDEKEQQQISINNDYKHFMNIYRKCTKEPYYSLIINSTLAANNSLRFRKNFLLAYKNDTN